MAKTSSSTASPCENQDTLNFMNAIEAHVRWKIRLEAYINGTSQEHLDADVIARDDQCVLGKWLYGAGGARFGEHPLFAGLKETHNHFHRCAGEIVRTVDAGQPEEARGQLCQGDYAKHSHRIKSELARLALEIDHELGESA